MFLPRLINSRRKKKKKKGAQKVRCKFGSRDKVRKDITEFCWWLPTHCSQLCQLSYLAVPLHIWPDLCPTQFFLLCAMILLTSVIVIMYVSLINSV